MRRTPAHITGSPRDPRAMQQELRAAGAVIRQMTIPWDRLFRELASSADETIALMRRLWTEENVSFHGRFFTVVIPLALTSYYPARAILGRDPLDAFHWLAPFAGFAFLALMLQFFRFGIRRHTSTGS